MDPIPPKNPVPADPLANQIDPSFQVMPREGTFTNEVKMPPAPAPTPPAPTAPTPHDGLPTPPPRPPSSFPPLPMQEAKPRAHMTMAIILVVILVLIVGGLAYWLLGRKTPTTSTTQTATTATTSQPAPGASQLPKAWLQQYFSQDLDSSGNCNQPTICGDTADPDNDGLTNYQEFKLGTNPMNPDTDGDGIADGDEVNVYLTDPTLKYTDRRDIVSQNNWTDAFQMNNNYDPLTPGVKFTAARLQQIATAIVKYGLHAPTTTTITNPALLPVGTAPSAQSQPTQ